MDLASILALVSSVPVVGKVLAIVLGYVAPVAALATALVAIMHVLVQVCQALAMFPVFAKLQSLADSLKKDDDAVSGFFATKVKPILDRLSLLPMPSKQ